jgi:hypothetical protein
MTDEEALRQFGEWLKDHPGAGVAMSDDQRDLHTTFLNFKMSTAVGAGDALGWERTKTRMVLREIREQLARWARENDLDEASQQSFPASDPPSSGSGATLGTPSKESQAPGPVQGSPAHPDLEAEERWEDEGGVVRPARPAGDPPVEA